MTGDPTGGKITHVDATGKLLGVIGTGRLGQHRLTVPASRVSFLPTDIEPVRGAVLISQGDPCPRSGGWRPGARRSRTLARKDSPVRTIPLPTTEQATLTECAVLGLLARRELSGYDLVKAADRSVGFFWTPARSQLYALLPKLVERGLLKARRIEQDERPDKTLYGSRRRVARRCQGAPAAVAAPVQPQLDAELRLFSASTCRRALSERWSRRAATTPGSISPELEEIEQRPAWSTTPIPT